VTLLTPPAFVQAGTYTALLDRIHTVTVPTIRDFTLTHRARQGFLPSRVPTYTNPSGMQINVTACAGVVANTFATDAGDYRFSNPSSQSVTLAASSPTQNRIDVVGFQVKDNFYDASGLNSITMAIIQGANSAGAPTAPTLPNSFIPIVECLINANAVVPTSMTSRIQRTALDGTPLGVATTTERNALGTVPSGTFVDRLDRNAAILERYDGTAWRTIGMAVGSSGADLSAAVTNGFAGQLAYRSDLGRYQRFLGSAFNNVQPVFHGYQAVAQTFTNNTAAAATLDSELFDELAGHSTSSNTSRYTPPIPGLYIALACVAFTNGFAGPCSLAVRRNGTLLAGTPVSTFHAVNQAAVANSFTAWGIFDMNGSTDYLEAWGYQNSGGSQATLVSTWATALMVFRLV
jgi:hypothetical protein